MVSRHIPSCIKRQLRQEAGFGCCVCGHPFVEYHHIVEFSEVPRHHAEDMIVLCPIHHHQCTVGALDVTQQRGFKKNPFNLQRGFADGQLVTSSTVIAVAAGSNEFIGAGFKFIVDNESLLGLRSDSERRLLMSVTLYSEFDDLLLHIHDNEWLAGDPLPWDLEFGYNQLRLKNAARKVNLEIDARNSPVSVKGTLWRKGHGFTIRTDSVMCDGKAKNVGFENLGLVALALRIDSATGNVSILSDPRLGGGSLISWPDPVERLKKGVEAFKNLCAEANLGRNEKCVCGSGQKIKDCHPEYC